MNRLKRCTLSVVILAAGSVWATATQKEAPKLTDITATGVIAAQYPGLKADELQEDAKLLAQLNAIVDLHITSRNGEPADSSCETMVGIVPLETARDLWLGTENRGKSVEFTGVLNEQTQQVRIVSYTILEEEWDTLLPDPGSITNKREL